MIMIYSPYIPYLMLQTQNPISKQWNVWWSWSTLPTYHILCYRHRVPSASSRMSDDHDLLALHSISYVTDTESHQQAVECLMIMIYSPYIPYLMLQTQNLISKQWNVRWSWSTLPTFHILCYRHRIASASSGMLDDHDLLSLHSIFYVTDIESHQQAVECLMIMIYWPYIPYLMLQTQNPISKQQCLRIMIYSPYIPYLMLQTQNRISKQ